MAKKKKEICAKEGDTIEIINNTEKEESDTYTRSIQIATLNTQVLVTSTDPKDTLSIIKEMAVSLIDKYKKDSKYESNIH
jgi:hypothetical protein